MRVFFYDAWADTVSHMGLARRDRISLTGGGAVLVFQHEMRKPEDPRACLVIAERALLEAHAAGRGAVSLAVPVELTELTVKPSSGGDTWQISSDTIEAARDATPGAAGATELTTRARAAVDAAAASAGAAVAAPSAATAGAASSSFLVVPARVRSFTE